MTPFASLLTDDIFILALIVLVLVLAGLVLYLAVKLSRLTKGARGDSLEAIIHELHTGLARHSDELVSLKQTSDNHHARLSRATRGVSTIRFDPFQNAGGQQSFATALIDECGDGVVLSGIHARDGVRVYAKEVHAFSSERELSEDEAAAIVAARSKL